MGTYPGTAEKPAVSHPGFVPIKISKIEARTNPIHLPFTMSLNIAGFAYMLGFRNPIGPFPALMRSSLIRLMTAANIGVLAEVPPDREKLPPL